MAALEWQLHATLVVRELRRLTYRVQRSGGRGTEQKEREKREREEKGVVWWSRRRRREGY